MPGARTSALPSLRVAIVPERLESCIRRLDPADRALLDLSLNRGIPDAAMAPVLRCDPMRLAWKRARALERVASRLGLSDPADLARVRSALAELPSRAWLPLELQAAPAPAVLEPPEPVGEEPRVMRPVAGPPAAARPAQPPAAHVATPGSGEGVAPAAARSAQAIAVRPTLPARPSDARSPRPIGRAASSLIGGLSERAKRAYPRETMTTRARRAAGALALGAAAALTLRRR